MTTVATLVKALHGLESTPNLKLFKNTYISRETTEVLDVVSLAEDILILPTGKCNWDAIFTLRQHGYDVFPVERDRYGWVIGGIGTRVGVLLYG